MFAVLFGFYQFCAWLDPPSWRTAVRKEFPNDPCKKKNWPPKD